MIAKHLTPQEYYWTDSLKPQEKQFLAGLIYGLKSALSLSSCLVYIEDLNTRLIVWLSNPSSCIELTELGNPPISIESIGLYDSEVERERVVRLDREALAFLQEHDPTSMSEYKARSNAFLRVRGSSLIYDRTVNFLPMLGSSSPRFRICRLSISTHTQIRELKVYKDGDNHYHKLSPGYTRWEEKDFLELSEREQMILLLSAKGITEQEIAHKLCLSLARLKSIKGEMFKQLHVKNITQAIERACAYGLITFKASENEK